MAQVLVRNLDDQVLVKLKRRARSKGRSLQSELKAILDEAAEHSEKATLEEMLQRTAPIRERMKERRQTDSLVLLREDRDR
jgi:antitoxin FitA